jgi:hypothetical protein
MAYPGDFCLNDLEQLKRHYESPRREVSPAEPRYPTITWGLRSGNNNYPSRISGKIELTLFQFSTRPRL